MGYGRIEAISYIAASGIIPRETEETEKQTAISLVQAKSVKEEVSPYVNMGLEISGNDNPGDLHPKKTQVPQKSKNPPKAIPLHEVKILNEPASEKTRTDKMEIFSDSSYIIYDEHGKFKCSYSEDGKLALNKVPVSLGYSESDKDLKYAFEKYSYDEMGKCTRFTKFDSGGNVEYFTDYKYDENGNKIQDINYKPDGRVKSFANYVYGEDGKQITCNYYNEKGNFMYYTIPESLPSFLPPKEEAMSPEIIEYNNTILIQKPDKANKEVISTAITVVYDENGYAEKIYENGKLLYDIIRFDEKEIGLYHKYEYNKEDQLIRESIYNGDGMPSAFWKYEYDEISGNRIKDIQYKKNGEPVVLYVHEYDEYNERVLSTEYNAITGKKEAEYPGGEFFTEPGCY